MREAALDDIGAISESAVGYVPNKKPTRASAACEKA